MGGLFFWYVCGTIVSMATATQTKTDTLLKQVLREVREIRAIVEARPAAQRPIKVKKHPKWLQAALDDEKAGRISGPFNTVDELMADLNAPGK